MISWIRGAIKHKGALRGTAARLGLVHGDEPLSASDLGAMRAKAKKSGDKKLARRVNLAETLGKLRGNK